MSSVFSPIFSLGISRSRSWVHTQRFRRAALLVTRVSTGSLRTSSMLMRTVRTMHFRGRTIESAYSFIGPAYCVCKASGIIGRGWGDWNNRSVLDPCFPKYDGKRWSLVRRVRNRRKCQCTLYFGGPRTSPAISFGDVTRGWWEIVLTPSSCVETR